MKPGMAVWTAPRPELVDVAPAPPLPELEPPAVAELTTLLRDEEMEPATLDKLLRAEEAVSDAPEATEEPLAPAPPAPPAPKMVVLPTMVVKVEPPEVMVDSIAEVVMADEEPDPPAPPAPPEL